MPASVKGGIELRKALKKFTPDLAKETQKQLGALLKPVTNKARGYIPTSTPLSGWGKPSVNGKFPEWDSQAAKRGIGYKTTKSKPNRQGFTSLARIQNASAAGSIYETAGRVNASGREQKRGGAKKTYGQSYNPDAGRQFIEAIDNSGQIVDARGTANLQSNKAKGRGIFSAWKEDGGKTSAAVLKSIEVSRDKFYAAVGQK